MTNFEDFWSHASPTIKAFLEEKAQNGFSVLYRIVVFWNLDIPFGFVVSFIYFIYNLFRKTF